MPVERRTTVDEFDTLAEEYARERAVSDRSRAHRLRDDMICAALPLAGRLARKYRGRAEPLSDLEQVARLGLVKAVDRYDPERGSFTAYAVHTVVGELKRHMRDRTWGVHVPRRMQDLTLTVARDEADLTRELGREPTGAELAQRAGISAVDLDHARLTAAGHRPVSLNAPVGDGAAQFGDLFGGPDESLERAADHLAVADLMGRLPARERFIVVQIFYGGRSQAEVGAELGISQMHVSRILSQVLAWMRAGMTTDRAPRWPLRSSRVEVPFDLAVRAGAGGDLEITVAGEMDRDNAEQLRTALLDLVCGRPAGLRVTLELSRVPLLDAAGIRVLLSVHEAARARNVRVTAVGLPPAIRGLAVTAGLRPMLAESD